MNHTEKPYRVDLWGSEPGENDDCWTGDEFTTKEEAEFVYLNPEIHFRAAELANTAWLELDGPNVHEERQMFGYKAKPNFSVENEAAISKPPAVDFGTPKPATSN